MAGHLVRVLPGYSISAAPLSAIYPRDRHLASRVRLFIDYLAEHLRKGGDGMHSEPGEFSAIR